MAGGYRNPGSKDKVLEGVPIGTASFGKPLPIVYGTTRIAGNVIWMPAESHHTEQGSSGGKGGTPPSTAGDRYYQGVGIAVCEGPITGYGRVWRDKELFPNLAAVESAYPFAAYTGARPQSPWSYPGLDTGRVLNGSFTGTVPTTAPYEVTVPSTGTMVPWAATRGVTSYDPTTYAASLLYWTPNPAPNAIQFYQVSGAGQPLTLRFNAAQAGRRVDIPYIAHDVQGKYSGLGYGGTAYVISARLGLGSSNSLKNYSFEVNGLLGSGDQNPASIVADLFTNGAYGLGWDAARVVVDVGQDGTAASSFRRYCEQAGFLLSPALEEQKAAIEHIQWLLDATNAAMVWSEGKLKIIPLGDTPVGAYAPVTSPVYDLGPDDFIMSGPDEDPIAIERRSQADTRNACPVEFLEKSPATDAASAYNVSVVEDIEQGDVDASNGQVRRDSAASFHCITSRAHAQRISRIRAQRSCYIRSTYRFRLGWKMSLLEPLDLVTLTEPTLGLSSKVVRIKAIEEDPDTGELAVEAEDWPFGVATATQYDTQAGDGGGSNAQVDPLNTNAPVIYAPPAAATGDVPELWIATSGGAKDWGGAQVWLSWDGGSSYVLAGEVGASAAGYLAASLPSGPPIDTTNTLEVDVRTSGAALSSVSQADRDALLTACLVEEEILAYQNVSLVGDGVYDLTSLLRGRLGTASVTHLSGAPFIRLDGAMLRAPISATRYGQTIQVKLVSFNLTRTRYQDPSSVPVWSYSLPSAASVGYNVAGTGQLPFTLAPERFNLDEWELVVGNAGALSTVSGQGVSGGDILRASGNVWLVHKRLFPYDPSLEYRLACRVRQSTEPTVGGKTFYMGLEGVAADGVTLVNTTAANSTSSQHYVSDGALTNSWSEKNGYWQGTAATGQSGGTATAPNKVQTNVRYVRPLLIFNHSGGNGVQDLDYLGLSVVDPAAMAQASTGVANAAAAQQTANNAATAASNAQVSADQANAKLADIASDSVLTPGEKPPLISEKATIDGEYSGIEQAGTTFGNTTQRTAYVNAKSALDTYLASLTTPTAWNSTAGNTAIVAATFRQKFLDYYNARQGLLNANAEKARSVAAAAIPNAANAVTAGNINGNGIASPRNALDRALQSLGVSSDLKRVWYRGSQSGMNSGAPLLIDPPFTTGATYYADQVVSSGGSYYRCTADVANASIAPASDAAHWSLMSGVTTAARERLRIGSWRTHVAIGGGYYSYALKLWLCPKLPFDNLDGVRFVALEVWNNAGTWVDTRWIPVPDRRYNVTTDDTHTDNASCVDVFWLGPACTAYASGYLDCYLRMTLYGSVNGATRIFRSVNAGWGTSGDFTGGATIPGGSAPPPPPPPTGGTTDPGEDCVAPETPVLTPGGLWVSAGALREGDRVLTMHEHTLDVGEHRVVGARTRRSSRIRVEFEDGRALTVSPPHRLATLRRGWRAANTLQPGEAIVGMDGRHGIVRRVAPASAGPVVRLSVEGARTYISDGLLSHNLKRLLT